MVTNSLVTSPVTTKTKVAGKESECPGLSAKSALPQGRPRCKIEATRRIAGIQGVGIQLGMHEKRCSIGFIRFQAFPMARRRQFHGRRELQQLPGPSTVPAKSPRAIGITSVCPVDACRAADQALGVVYSLWHSPSR